MRSLLCLFLTLIAAFFTANAQQNVNFTSSNLPIVVISTNGQPIVNDPKITADMGIIYNGEGNRNQITDAFNHYNGKIGIEIRGQSSQMFPMKSYSLELWDDAGESVDKSLFGLPKESDWVLYAPYTDKTLMRNFMAYTLSRNLGHWAANCRFVEVILNGKYVGVYVFMEKIKRNKGRVNIPKMEKTDETGDAVTGGYIFSLDKEPNGWFSQYLPPNAAGNQRPQFSYIYPKPDDINNAQKTYIRSFVDSFENALHGNNFQDPQNGVRKFAELNSFMDYFIVNEVSRNVDGYRLSSYFYKNRNSTDRKIYAGPVWDYDLAFRNADYCDGSLTNGWAYEFNKICPGDGAGLIPFWWNRLMEDTAWVGDLRCRWMDLRSGILSDAGINHLIDSVTQLLGEAQQRHFTAWPILGQYVWPNPQPIPSSYAGEITALKDWLKLRLQWIDKNLPDKGRCGDNTPDPAGSFGLWTLANPFIGNADIRIKSKIQQAAHMQVIDMTGRKLSAKKLLLNPGSQWVSLDAQSWPAGIYLIHVFNDAGEKQTLKMMKSY